jgi:hypothetical protein
MISTAHGKLPQQLKGSHDMSQPNKNPALPRGPAYDAVSKPSHYNTDGGVECITYIKQVLGVDGFIAYCRGNVIKYNHRAMYKGNPTEDLAKAQQYLQWANDTLKEKHK